MAQFQPRHGAAGEDVLDVDDSDIGLDAPAPSLTPRSYTATPSHDDKPPHPSQHHRIPEPASAVQDVTRLRSAAHSPLAGLGRGDTRGPDADFQLPPWLCALQFLGRDRAWEQPGIKAIKKEETLCRAPLVAGVVTSCKPNGLGDLLVTLKDPTDTVAATVHKKVLLEGNNGQDISVGCVILLSKVAVFRPTRKACYLNINKVIKVFRKDCDAPSNQVISSNITERSEGSIDDIMTRLLGRERMMPIDDEITVTEVSLQRQGTSDSNNSTSTRDIYGRCGVGNNQEGGLQMLAGDPRRKNTFNCSTDGHPQQSLNNQNMTCSQASLSGSRVMFGDSYSMQASDTENLRQPFDIEKMLHSRKRLKSDATLPDGYGETANSRIDTENNQVLKRNMNAELDGVSQQFDGQHASIREPTEHQQKNFTAANAGIVQQTKEYATTISGTLLNPKKTLPVASLAGWTDDQLSELFADY
ncbi:unnamed protein product [Urochloa decumbens]|uniref:Homologous recombination OB-fold protein OB-fold domain-containing protein n=1 Tax=Urochloa decumbens TaxID=240449 RepID=A0ABC9FKI7_9POAL